MTVTRIKLTDLQLVLLSAAAARPDFMLLPPPESVRARGKTLDRTLARMLEAALVEEVTAGHEAEAWRETEDGWRFGLRIAPAGLGSIGLPVRAAVEPDDEPLETAHARDAETVPASVDLTSANADTDGASTGTAPEEEPAAARPLIRPGTKQARLIEMLSAPGGAGIDAFCEALGWQAHTTRAALTGLRKKGLAIENAKGADGRSVYRIGQAEATADAV